MEIHIWGYKSLRIAGKILAGQQNLEVLKTSFLYSLKPIECKKLFLRIRTWPLVGFNKSLDLENFALDHTWGQACGDSKPAVRGFSLGWSEVIDSSNCGTNGTQRNPTGPRNHARLWGTALQKTRTLFCSCWLLQTRTRFFRFLH